MLEQTDSRRSERQPNIYDDGFLRVEYDNYYIACGEMQLKLSRANFLIIALLVRNLGEYVPAENVWQQLWGDRKPLNPESMKVHIHGVRQALAPFHIQIETKPNTGYRLIPGGH